VYSVVCVGMSALVSVLGSETRCFQYRCGYNGMRVRDIYSVGVNVLMCVIFTNVGECTSVRIRDMYKCRCEYSVYLTRQSAVYTNVGVNALMCVLGMLNNRVRGIYSVGT